MKYRQNLSLSPVPGIVRAVPGRTGETNPTRNMYLQKLLITNLKLLRDLELDFTRDGSPRMWTVIVGENGLCKTSILRAIALAAAGVDGANELADTAALPDRRLRRPVVDIYADFGFSKRYEPFRTYPGIARKSSQRPGRIASYLQLSPGWQRFRGGSRYDLEDRPPGSTEKDPLAEARGRGLGHWFVAGYGVNRNLPVPMTNRGAIPTRLRLQTLFDNGPMIGTGFADIFTSEPAKAVAYAKALKQTLLAHTELLPRISGLELRGMKGKATAMAIVERHKFRFDIGGKPVAMPATWLSQGYQSTIAWLADLVGQVMWEADGPVPAKEMEGLVLVDELDLHLHPVWQQSLIESLKHTFPRLQFVATTHSPLLLSGLDDDEIVRLAEDDHGNVAVVNTGGNTPRLMTGSELYNTYFGVKRTNFEALLQEYALLSGTRERSNVQDRRMRVIQGQLGAQGITPEWQPEPLRRKPRR